VEQRSATLDAARGSQPNEIRPKHFYYSLPCMGSEKRSRECLLTTSTGQRIDLPSAGLSERFSTIPFEQRSARRSALHRNRPTALFVPHVFLTLKAPLGRCSTYNVRSRTQPYTKTGHSFQALGPQCLRHACATRLLYNGLSFIDIATFWASDTQSVNVYGQIEHPYAARGRSH